MLIPMHFEAPSSALAGFFQDTAPTQDTAQQHVHEDEEPEGSAVPA